MNISIEYKRIIENELRINNPKNAQTSLIVNDAIYVINVAKRILEIAKNSTVLRCGNRIGHLTEEQIAYESDGAHTNLVRALTDYILDAVYEQTGYSLNYTRREIDEAILIHDLPENAIGDIPDNGSRNEAEKHLAEGLYYEDFFQYYEPYDYLFRHRIQSLLYEMEAKSSVEGRIIYAADKLAAIIMMLCYDYLGLYPHAHPNEESMTKVNQIELNTCEIKYQKGILLSELWTVDFLVGRKLVKYDDTGFFTALLVACTLLCHGKWYNWRERNYPS